MCAWATLHDFARLPDPKQPPTLHVMEQFGPDCDRTGCVAVKRRGEPAASELAARDSGKLARARGPAFGVLSDRPARGGGTLADCLQVRRLRCSWRAPAVGRLNSTRMRGSRAQATAWQGGKGGRESLAP